MSNSITLLARSLPDGSRLTANAIVDQTGQPALVLGLKDRNQNGAMRRRRRITIPWADALELSRAVQDLARQAKNGKAS